MEGRQVRMLDRAVDLVPTRILAIVAGSGDHDDPRSRELANRTVHGVVSP